jgi:hypothetical protein
VPMSNLDERAGARYSVSVFSSPVSLLLPFAVHVWFVVSRDGVESRWDVWSSQNRGGLSWGHVHRDLYPPRLGTRVFPGRTPAVNAWRFASQEVCNISGGEGSAAEKLAHFIEASSPIYPNKNLYKIFPGPNSNSYVGWVLRECPSPGMKIPWRAFGSSWSN